MLKWVTSVGFFLHNSLKIIRVTITQLRVILYVEEFVSCGGRVLGIHPGAMLNTQEQNLPNDPTINVFDIDRIVNR